MNQNKEVTPLSRAGTTTEIPGPYISPEQTESFPLKSNPNSGKSNILRTCCCWSCCSTSKTGGTQGIGGLRPIIACFFAFSIALTVALALQIRFGKPQVPPHGSVASDSRECSQVGASILRKGGNAVDAAIATTVCLGVVLPHVTGIGGGGFIAIYDHRRRMVVDAIDFRESAPEKFSAESEASNGIEGNLAGRTVGIPGFLKGLGLAHKLYGRLSWAELITPSINLCRTGFLVPSNLITARSLLSSSSSSADLKQTNLPFWSHFESLEAGHNMKDLQMATTLQTVANEGPEAFYNGSLTDDLIEAIITSGGQLTRNDLVKYKPIRRPLIRVPFGPSSWVYSMGAPSGGPLLLSALRLYAEAYAQQIGALYPTDTERMNAVTESENASTILQNFSVKFTPTEPSVSGTTKVYVTPLPSQETTPSKKNSALTLDKGSKNADSTGKFKDPNALNNFKNRFQNSGLNSNWQESHSGEELGHAIIEPYKLKRSVSDLPLEREGSSGVEDEKGDLGVDVAELDLLLKSIKDASFLHSQLGDPDFSKYPDKGYQVTVDPSSQLKLTKDEILQDEDSELYKLLNHRPAGSNVAAVDANELYVSVISGLNTWFGSQVLTNGGYLLNNALVNFYRSKGENSSLEAAPPLNNTHPEAHILPPHIFPSARNKPVFLPKSSAQQLEASELSKRIRREMQEDASSDNNVASGKRPLTESVVAIVVPRRANEGSEGESYGSHGPESGVEPCGQRMILGSADAGSVAQVLIKIILKGLPLVEAIEATRVKPLASPRNYGVEVGPESVKWNEENIPLNSDLPKGTPLPLPYPSVNGVQEIGDVLASHSDSRGGGVAARF